MRTDFEKEYGLILPYHPAKQILTRLKKTGLIKQSEHKYIIDGTKISEDHFADTSAEQQRKLANLTRSLIEFAKKEKFDFTNESSEEALLSFFRENSLGFLSAAKEEGVLPKFDENKSAKYIVAKFIQDVQTAEPEKFSFLVDVAVGVVLANALAYGDDLSKLSSTRGLNIYFDTGYIFALLGINGEEMRLAFSELTQDLVGAGVKLFVFEHTYDEMMRILNGALFWMRQTDFDIKKASRALKYFVSNNFSESDVEVFITQIPGTFDTHKIQKASKPSYSKDIKYQISEEELKKLIIETYKSHDPFFDESQKDETIDKDVESIYSICKLRKGHIAYTLKDASHIFVTTNLSLARISGRIQSNDNAPFSIPPCITDVLIGTLIWLQQPIKTANLNAKKLIADAFAAVQPDKALVKKYFEEIESLRNKAEISGDEYYVLRTNRVALNLLSEKTKNDSHNFEPRTAREIMDELNKEHMAELRGKLENERKLRAVKTSELENQKTRNVAQDVEIRAVGFKLSKTIHFLASLFTWVIILLVIPLLVFFSVVNTFPLFLDSISFKIVAFVVLVILSFSGFSIPGFKKWLLSKMESFITKRLS